jgi:hypothetical protein
MKILLLLAAAVIAGSAPKSPPQVPPPFYDWSKGFKVPQHFNFRPRNL